MGVTFTAEAIVSVSINHNDQIALYESSNFTLTVSSPFAIGNSFDSTATELVVKTPAEFTLGNATTCAATAGTCTLSNGSFTVSPVGRSLAGFTVVLKNVVIPFISVASTSFGINFQYNGKDIAVVSSGVVVQPFCTSPCERCVTTQTVCASCLPSPNTAIYFYSVNSSCLTASECPAGNYPDLSSKLCSACVSPCLRCEDVDNCTACIANRWLF